MTRSRWTAAWSGWWTGSGSPPSRPRCPSAADVEQVADVFALLGDPNRVRLLVALLEGGEMCVCDLAAAAGMSESAASHAVRWLRAHRIVSAPRRQGRMMYYRLEDAHVRVLLDIALTHAQHTRALHPEATAPRSAHPEALQVEREDA